MKLVSRTLAVIRTLTAIWYFIGAALVFVLAGWLVWPISESGWFFEIIAALIAWSGVNLIRRGCEELTLNEPRRE